MEEQMIRSLDLTDVEREMAEEQALKDTEKAEQKEQEQGITPNTVESSADFESNDEYKFEEFLDLMEVF